MKSTDILICESRRTQSLYFEDKSDVLRKINVCIIYPKINGAIVPGQPGKSKSEHD